MVQFSKDHRIYLVTGKGGVGKSSLAAALGLSLSRQNRRVLLVEVGEKSYYSTLLGEPIGREPYTFSENLDVACWTGEGCLQELFVYILKVKALVDLFFSSKMMKALIRVAPALKELSILGKLTSGTRGFGPSLDYDCIVLDGFASGHFLSLLKVPKGILDVIKTGAMAEQTRDIQKVLLDHKLTKIVIATLPEELPITEAMELKDQLQGMGYQPDMVVNKVLNPPFQESDLSSILANEVYESVHPFTEYIQSRLKRQASCFAKLKGAALQIPLIFASDSKKVVDQMVVNMEAWWKS